MSSVVKQPFYYLIILLLSFLFSCGSDPMSKALESEKIAIGNVNQVIVLCEKDIWEGPLGDSLRFYYGASYLILPQPEPIFDLRHYTMMDLNKEPIRKELRTFLVIGDMNDKYSDVSKLIKRDVGSEKLNQAINSDGYGISVARNKWARGQTLVYIYGENEMKLAENITKSYPAITKKIHETTKSVIEASAFAGGNNTKLAGEVFAKMKVKMRIPSSFYTAVSDEDIMWLRSETSSSSKNILLTRVPYVDQSQLTREGIKEIRNKLGKEYVSSTIPDSYMRINDVDLPLIINTIKFNGDYAIEARGIWDIVNDFMGGAFVSYLIYNPEKKDLLFMDCFIHAPQKDKRDMMQELEFILHTATY